MAFGCPHCQKEINNAVPRDEMIQHRTQANELKAQVEALTTANTNLEAKVTELSPLAESATDLRSQLDVLQGQAATWTVEKDILTSGITSPEGVSVAMTLYQALPDDGRPATASEWLSSESLPLAVRAYLPSTESTQAKPEPVKPVSTQRVSGTPEASPGMTYDVVSSMSPAEYAANADAIKRLMEQQS